MDKLSALRYFCVACETLNFRETAHRLAVSPQVVSRTIAQLEKQLGEQLFKRNTRNIVLTEFGSQFLLKAERLLAESEALFATKLNENEMSGVVRITLPPLPRQAAILTALLEKLAPYPDVVIDWQVDLDKLHSVCHQIDIGLRLCLEPEADWVAHHICNVREKIVASPLLIKRLGKPKNLQELQQRYPLSGLFNPKTGRVWNWYIDQQQQIGVIHPAFIANNMESELIAARTGRTVAQLLEWVCEADLIQGQLIELFPTLNVPMWKLYLYRPYQGITPTRVAYVFACLKEILVKFYQTKNE
ncbi:LysR family transcriptional regulator [Muribacter muris]|uniref:LysR family transcriptional regulator n=1 Tax=Muribacter muris TaxID=67855 RepID=A0A4Y9JUG1_9PAST|nr:LysR family transcriptional regulator [Muribacter muris]MBF0785829.1 LysR family transcriptional regulator [Muribacter muris]MBF0827086.1 LysR family transcriptional regulator [Muribacter muris]TFV08529.1 LysR family transcriptional regulator [Muribacter muris]